MNAEVNKTIVILGGIIILLGMVGTFFFGRATVKQVDSVETRIERDTVIVRDTIREYYPHEVVRTIVRTEQVKVPVIVRDTIRDTVHVKLPIEERIYASDEYRAVIEGFNPRLKSMEVYPRTAYINTTEIVKERKRWGVTLGVQGGYGYTPKGTQPYVGLGVTFGYSF